MNELVMENFKRDASSGGRKQDERVEHDSLDAQASRNPVLKS
jgi:hypothetical protein